MFRCIKIDLDEIFPEGPQKYEEVDDKNIGVLSFIKRREVLGNFKGDMFSEDAGIKNVKGESMKNKSE